MNLLFECLSPINCPKCLQNGIDIKFIAKMFYFNHSKTSEPKMNYRSLGITFNIPGKLL